MPERDDPQFFDVIASQRMYHRTVPQFTLLKSEDSGVESNSSRWSVVLQQDHCPEMRAMTDADALRAHLVGINHVDLEVGDIEAALDFYDPWGNRIQIVASDEIQFTEAEPILSAMDLSGLEKSESAIAELFEKGMAPK